MPKKYGDEIVYKYQELGPWEQQQAFNTWERYDTMDIWYEPEEEYIGEALTALGFNLKTHQVKLMSGKMRTDYAFSNEPSEYFNFAAEYEYRSGWRDMWKKCTYWKEDDVMETLGERLQVLQKKRRWLLVGNVPEVHGMSFRSYKENGYDSPIKLRHRDGDYRSMWYDDEGPTVTDEEEAEFQDIVYGLCDWAHEIMNGVYSWHGSREKALGDGTESDPGEFEEGDIYFSEDGTEIHFNVSESELENYEEDEDNE